MKDLREQTSVKLNSLTGVLGMEVLVDNGYTKIIKDIHKGVFLYYIAESGDIIKSPEYKSIKSIRNCNLYICENTKFGLIDGQTNIIIETNCSNIEQLCRGVILIKLNSDFSYLIDYDGKDHINKTFRKIEVSKTCIGNILRCETVRSSELYLSIKSKDTDKHVLIKLRALNKLLYDKVYTIEESQIVVYGGVTYNIDLTTYRTEHLNSDIKEFKQRGIK